MMQCPLWQKLTLNLFQMLNCVYSLKKIWEEEFLKCQKRYSKANNSHLKSYDPKQESEHIIYSYANNLYGYAMSKFPSTSSSKWIDPKNFDSNKYSCNSSKGCAFVKKEYVLLYERLQLYLRLGLKTQKIHRLLEFSQLQWLKPFV